MISDCELNRGEKATILLGVTLYYTVVLFRSRIPYFMCATFLFANLALLAGAGVSWYVRTRRARCETFRFRLYLGMFLLAIVLTLDVVQPGDVLQFEDGGPLPLWFPSFHSVLSLLCTFAGLLVLMSYVLGGNPEPSRKSGM